MTTDQKLAQVVHSVMLRATIKSAQIRHEIAAMTERDRRSLGQKFRWLLKGYKG